MGHRILIYDDDRDILLVTTAILEMKGYEVLCRDHCRNLNDDLNNFQPQGYFNGQLAARYGWRKSHTIHKKPGCI